MFGRNIQSVSLTRETAVPRQPLWQLQTGNSLYAILYLLRRRRKSSYRKAGGYIIGILLGFTRAKAG